MKCNPNVESNIREEYNNQLLRQNKQLEEILSAKTKTLWTSNIDGVYCETGFMIGKNQNREMAQSAFLHQLEEANIRLKTTCLDSSMREIYTRNHANSNVVVFAKITTVSELISLSQQLESATERSTPLGGEVLD